MTYHSQNNAYIPAADINSREKPLFAEAVLTISLAQINCWNFATEGQEARINRMVVRPWSLDHPRQWGDGPQGAEGKRKWHVLERGKPRRSVMNEVLGGQTHTRAHRLYHHFGAPYCPERQDSNCNRLMVNVTNSHSTDECWSAHKRSVRPRDLISSLELQEPK